MAAAREPLFLALQTIQRTGLKTQALKALRLPDEVYLMFPQGEHELGEFKTAWSRMFPSFEAALQATRRSLRRKARLIYEDRDDSPWPKTWQIVRIRPRLDRFRPEWDNGGFDAVYGETERKRYTRCEDEDVEVVWNLQIISWERATRQVQIDPEGFDPIAGIEEGQTSQPHNEGTDG